MAISSAILVVLAIGLGVILPVVIVLVVVMLVRNSGRATHAPVSNRMAGHGSSNTPYDQGDGALGTVAAAGLAATAFDHTSPESALHEPPDGAAEVASNDFFDAGGFDGGGFDSGSADMG